MKDIPIHKVGIKIIFNALDPLLHGVQTSSALGLSAFHPLSHQGFKGNMLPSVLIFL